MSRLNAITAAGVAMAALIAPAYANAQANAQVQQVDGNGNAVTTAQKPGERVADTHIPATEVATEVSAATLRTQQIDDTVNLVKVVPSLTVQSGNNPSNNGFRIRGIGTSQLSPGLESSVSVVVDGVVQARLAQNFTDLADIERVEILGGPQGILFGRNASAGVINVVTVRPSRTFEAKGNITVAQDDEYRAGGTISGPLTSTLRARLTGFYNDVGGYHRNAADGSREGGLKSWGLRGKLDWDATDRINLLATAEYRKTDSLCCQFNLVDAQNPVRAALYAAAGVPVVADGTIVWGSARTAAHSEQKSASLIGGIDLDWATIVSISAFQDFSVDANFEPDRIGASTPIFLAPGSSAQFDVNATSSHVRQVSQELRLESQGAGGIMYTVGAYYAHLDLDRYAERRRATCTGGVVGQPCAPATIRYQSLATDAALRNDHLAAFGRLEARIAGGLSFIGGLRVQHDMTEVSGGQIGLMVTGDTPFGPILPAGSTRTSDDAVTGKVGFKYEFSRLAQVHAFYNRGYKGPGIDLDITSNFAANPVIAPEHVNAYELGFKGATANGAFSLAISAYRADYRNLQVQANRSDPTLGSIAFLPANVRASRTQGVEIEARLKPSQRFTVNAAFAYKRSRFNSDGLNCPILAQAAAPIVALGGVRPVNSCYRYQYSGTGGAIATSGPVQDVRGGILPGAPDWRVNISPRYEMGIGKLLGFAQVDLSYQSDQQFALEQDPLQVQDGYMMVDASIGVRTRDARYSLTLFVKNLFDTNYYANVQTWNLLPSDLTKVDTFALRLKNADRYFGAALGFRL